MSINDVNERTQITLAEAFFLSNIFCSSKNMIHDGKNVSYSFILQQNGIEINNLRVFSRKYCN